MVRFNLWASKAAKCFLQGIKSRVLLLQSFANYRLCTGGSKVPSSFFFFSVVNSSLVPDSHICLGPQLGEALSTSRLAFFVYACAKYMWCIIYHRKHFEINNSVVLSTFTMLFSQHHCSQNFFVTPKQKLCTL